MLGIKLKLAKGSSTMALHDYTLIMPSVSVGNVGQLAVDLLISSMELSKYAVFHHSALYPFIGHDPYEEGSDSVTTAADLHVNTDLKLLVLQIRSPIIPAKKDQFLNDLIDWLQNMNFSDIIIMSSCHAHMRHDNQMVGSQLRYVTNDNLHPKVDILKEIGPTEMESRVDEYGSEQRNVPGAGFTYSLLAKCSLPCVALMKFVDEGDNTQDALMLASYLNSWLHLIKDNKSWKMPFSWNNMYGGSPPQEIY